jgi:hypothetical protein
MPAARIAIREPTGSKSRRTSLGGFSHLSAGDRQAILEILRDTKKDLPEYWHK